MTLGMLTGPPIPFLREFLSRAPRVVGVSCGLVSPLRSFEMGLAGYLEGTRTELRLNV